MSHKLACCPDMRQACETGTDNEGYGRAVWWCHSGFRIGTRMSDIDYCPWCGTPVKRETTP